MSPPFSGPKIKEKTSELSTACYLLYAGFFFGLSFDAEDGGDMLLRNAC
jgi:hypothetical protein